MQYPRRIVTPLTTGPRFARARRAAGTAQFSVRARARFTAARRTLLCVAAATVLAVPALLTATASPASAAEGNVIVQNVLLYNNSSTKCIYNPYGLAGANHRVWGDPNSCSRWDIYQVGRLNQLPLVQVVDSKGNCLDSSGTDIATWGPILAWPCSTADPYGGPFHDPFTVFIAVTSDGFPVVCGSSVDLVSYGAWLSGSLLSVDVDAGADAYGGGPLIQWPYNGQDPYQSFQIRC